MGIIRCLALKYRVRQLNNSPPSLGTYQFARPIVASRSKDRRVRLPTEWPTPESRLVSGKRGGREKETFPPSPMPAAAPAALDDVDIRGRRTRSATAAAGGQGRGRKERSDHE